MLAGRTNRRRIWASAHSAHAGVARIIFRAIQTWTGKKQLNDHSVRLRQQKASVLNQKFAIV
jgi:hypothetical protein